MKPFCMNGGSLSSGKSFSVFQEPKRTFNQLDYFKTIILNIYYFLSFKIISCCNHKGSPCSIGTLASCIQRHTFQDHDMKQQGLWSLSPVLMRIVLPFQDDLKSITLLTQRALYQETSTATMYILPSQCQPQVACHFKMSHKYKSIDVKSFVFRNTLMMTIQYLYRRS